VVELPTWHPEANKNGAYMPIKLENSEQLGKVSCALNIENIQNRHYFAPSLDKIFVDSFNYGTPISHQVSDGILCLPMHAHLSKLNVQKVIHVIKGSMK
jgi:dTDP-4-amino-4,6-dideoxygalactose transaminase